jgi:predicted DCC family thiol-disulfide oxidoreductase YuxK
MNLGRELAKDSRIAIVYDGDCPFCSTYVTMTRLRNAVGTPTLLNARERPDVVKALAEQDASLDMGLAVYYQGGIYTGGDAMHVLALLTTPVDFANRLAAVEAAELRASHISLPPRGPESPPEDQKAAAT